MSFVSASFLIFFLVFLVVFYSGPKNLRWLILLLSSYLFYGYEHPFFMILLAVSTVVDYFSALQIEKSDEKVQKKIYLVLSLLVNLGLLVGYKYMDFLSEIIFGEESILNYRGYYTGSGFIIPAGISFYTFQTISYTVDVYRGKTKAEKHLGYFAAFVSFFPQLVAGPIERGGRLLPQLRDLGKKVNVAESLYYLVWGLFKKLVIADRIGVVIDSIFQNYTEYSWLTIWLAGSMFVVQAYCDFSGYTNVARGLAGLVGVDLSLNWNFPLFRSSFRGFWRNWHITLSEWFKDYIYVPLGGKKNGFLMWSSLVLLVFFISGLWHGANLTFVVFGVLNALLIIGEYGFERVGFKVKPSWMKWLIVFVIHGLVFLAFRSESTAHFFNLLSSIFEFGPVHLISDYSKLDMWTWSHVVNSMALVFFVYVEYRSFKKGGKPIRGMLNPIVLSSLVIVILVLGEFSNKPFIYFQF